MSKELESIIIDTVRELTAEDEIEVEQAVEDELGVRISLADEKALSQRNSPYRTVKALAEYAHAEIEANQNDG